MLSQTKNLTFFATSKPFVIQLLSLHWYICRTCTDPAESYMVRRKRLTQTSIVIDALSRPSPCWFRAPGIVGTSSLLHWFLFLPGSAFLSLRTLSWLRTVSTSRSDVWDAWTHTGRDVGSQVGERSRGRVTWSRGIHVERLSKPVNVEIKSGKWEINTTDRIKEQVNHKKAITLKSIQR